MKSTKIGATIQSSLKRVLNRYPLVYDIVAAVVQQGGHAFLVGGAVRDLVLGYDVKDLDIEIHGLRVEQVEELLRRDGRRVDFVGKAFGVFRVYGLDVDWSLPRFDSSGRKPAVVIDPFMGIEEGLRRRDLTMNAMAIDLQTFKLIDPFNGITDMQEGVLRTPDTHFFVEDPLRFFRVMQFVGRFEMYPDEALNNVCKQMDVHTVSVERIDDEFKKLFLKSKYPSLGIRWIHAIGRLRDIFPEISATVNLPQESSWHPEGDVFEHSMQALDAAAFLTYNNEQEKLIVMYAALCHDLGKIITTEKINGVWRSLGHDKEGVVLAKTLLKRITRNKIIIDSVGKLVRYHLQPEQFITNHASLSAYKRLAHKLAPHVTLEMLAKLALAEQRARNPKSHKPLTIDVPIIDEFLDKAKKANVLLAVEKPILLGRDLLDKIPPGPAMGKLLKQAYTLQLEEGITDKEELKRRVLSTK